MTLGYLLNWLANAIMVVVLPAWLGSAAAPFWLFLAYAVAAGASLTLVEDLRYARELFARSDIHDYLQVRIAIVIVVGIVPFLSSGAVV